MSARAESQTVQSARTVRTGRRSAGFTLIELLAVMAIMVILSTIVVGGYFGMVRGSAAISAEASLYNNLTLARQRAMMNGARTYLMIDNETTYTVVQEAGVVTQITGPYVYDDYADLQSMVGVGGDELFLYNMESGERSRIQKVEPPLNPGQGHGNRYRFVLASSAEAARWQKYDRYGWPVGPTQYLPKGFVFRNSPGEWIEFEATGASNGGTLTLVEEIAPDKPITLTVEPTGHIQVSKNE